MSWKIIVGPKSIYMSYLKKKLVKDPILSYGCFRQRQQVILMTHLNIIETSKMRL